MARIGHEWWHNELGVPLHLRCGRVGDYEVRNSWHYVTCRGCDVRQHIPAPSPSHSHAMYGTAS